MKILEPVQKFFLDISYSFMNHIKFMTLFSWFNWCQNGKFVLLFTISAKLYVHNAGRNFVCVLSAFKDRIGGCKSWPKTNIIFLNIDFFHTWLWGLWNGQHCYKAYISFLLSYVILKVICYFSLSNIMNIDRKTEPNNISKWNIVLLLMKITYLLWVHQKEFGNDLELQEMIFDE